MKIVKTLYERLYKLLLGFGIPFFALSFIFENLKWLVGSVFCIAIGFCCKIKDVYNKRELAKLKKENLCYEGIVRSIIFSNWVKIGTDMTARVECSYKTVKGDCVVMSGYYLLGPFDTEEELCPKIYIDRNNSDKFIVELFRKK